MLDSRSMSEADAEDSEDFRRFSISAARPN